MRRKPGNSAKHFNSQPHKEADLALLLIVLRFRIFQLTASQGGWLHILWSHYSGNDISTHSLTRRLTDCRCSGRSVCWYFNSQPHKEADRHGITERKNWRHFNSQPHKEADGIGKTMNKDMMDISTHSLTRRLTTCKDRLLRFRVFQLTASQGGWLIPLIRLRFTWPFQLTASQGGWREIRQSLTAGYRFQLTASQGGWPIFGILTGHN